jgi:hypothetical protein
VSLFGDSLRGAFTNVGAEIGTQQEIVRGGR